MPGPPPNPSSGRSKKRGLTVLGPTPKGDFPPPPMGLRESVTTAWVAFWESPLANHVITSDYMALRRLFEMYERREEFDAEGMREPVSVGSQKQEVLNPLLKAVDVLDAKILALEDRFGMSPMARLKLQVQLGDASRSIAETNARLASSRSDAAPAPDPRRISK